MRFAAFQTTTDQRLSSSGVNDTVAWFKPISRLRIVPLRKDHEAREIGFCNKKLTVNRIRDTSYVKLTLSFAYCPFSSEYTNM